MIDVDKYVNHIKDELEYLKKISFTGNITFKVNFKQGGIANMNKGVDESVKLVDLSSN